MRNIQGDRLIGLPLLFLSISLLMLFSPYAVHTQNTSTRINLGGTQWAGKSISQANVDGSITVLTTTYTFEEQGKATLLIFISKGVGIATTATPDGNIPLNSARTLSGTYRLKGNSLYINFPDRAIEATVSGNSMKGILTAKANNQREEWIAAKVSNLNDASPVPKTTKSTQPITETDRAKRGEIAVDYLLEGEKLYRGGKYTEAIAKYDDGIKLMYDVPKWHVAFRCRRGEAKVKVQDYKGAIEDFNKCIQSSPGKHALEDSYEGRGDAKLAIKNYAGALADYNQFFQLFAKPYERESGVNVGDLSIIRDKRKAKVYKDRGTARYKLGQKVGACSDFSESCKLGNSVACDTAKIVCN